MKIKGFVALLLAVALSIAFALPVFAAAPETLGSQAVGAVVKIRVNGILRDFIVVHHGKPSSMYDDSFNGGTILMMKDVYEDRQLHGSGVNDYANSAMHAYLNSTFLNLIDVDIRAQVKSVKIPYRPGSGTASTVNSGASGLLSSVWLASCYELNWTYTASNPIPGDGAAFSYFSNTANIDAKRIAYLDGGVKSWLLRTPALTDSSRFIRVGLNGGIGVSSAVTPGGVRPVFVLPSALLVSAGEIYVNSPPTTPVGLTVPQSIYSERDISVTWRASTDPDGDTFTYILERSYNNGAYSQVAVMTGLSFSEKVLTGWNMLRYRVKARDALGNESAYVTSDIVAVMPNLPPTTPVGLTTPHGIYSGQDVRVMWQASTDPNGDEISYVLERSFNDGDYTQVAVTSNLSFSEEASESWDILEYRIKARDVWGRESAYTVSDVITVYHNKSPAEPAEIEVPQSIYSGQEITVSWGAATDPNGDEVTYILERSYDNGDYVQVDVTTDLSFSEEVLTDWNRLQYRVKARDVFGEESEFVTSDVVTVMHNQAPTAPAGITVPQSIYGGQNIRVDWSTSTDIDGDAITYVLERSYNGGDFLQVDVTVKLFFVELVPDGRNTLQYRVKAHDDYGNASMYTVSETVTVVRGPPGGGDSSTPGGGDSSGPGGGDSSTPGGGDSSGTDPPPYVPDEPSPVADMLTVLSMTYNAFNIPMNIYGFEFSFWDVLMFGLIVGAVLAFVGWIIHEK